jgi:hypothetical protein
MISTSIRRRRRKAGEHSHKPRGMALTAALIADDLSAAFRCWLRSEAREFEPRHLIRSKLIWEVTQHRCAGCDGFMAAVWAPLHGALVLAICTECYTVDLSRSAGLEDRYKAH